MCQIFWPWLTTFVMGDSSYIEPVQKYVDDCHGMRSSNDNDRVDPVGLSSLGVVDLDISIVPDVFGLWFPNELCVLIPDAGATLVDFHDIIMSDLHATPEWRARRIVPSDVTLLRRCWPKILFATMHKRQADMENLRRSCWHQPERASSHGRPGYCPQCKEYVAGALDRHMMNNHLELGQLWRCRWNGVLFGRAQLDHLRCKHGESQFLALENLGVISPPWTVPRDFWHTALQPDVSGIAVDCCSSCCSTIS